MHKCAYCGKPIYHPGITFTGPAFPQMWCQCLPTITQSATTNTTTIIRFVTSNTTSPLLPTWQCLTCKWFVHPAYHTEAECERLQGYNRTLDPQKVEVPKAFQEAFQGQELEL